MRHSKTLLTAALVSLLAACSNPEKAAEPVNAEVATSDAEETVELDRNDPNVLVCPVTGAMQLKDADGDSAMGEDHGKGGDYDGEYGAHHGGTSPQDDN